MASRGFLVRTRKPHGSLLSKQNKVPRRRKKKPDWDETTTDLTVHKATKEELDYRHKSHQSKNLTRVKLSKEKKTLFSRNSPVTPDTAERKKVAIFKEILYGQDDQKDILAESDKTMSVVKDLFGDDPKKYKAFPNVTVAPQQLEAAADRRACRLVADEPETPTHLSILSDSVMRTPALNELPGDEEQELSSSNSSPDGFTQSALQFESKLDLQRFQTYIAQQTGQAGEPQTTLSQGGEFPPSGWENQHEHAPQGRGAVSEANFTRGRGVSNSGQVNQTVPNDTSRRSVVTQYPNATQLHSVPTTTALSIVPSGNLSQDQQMRYHQTVAPAAVSVVPSGNLSQDQQMRYHQTAHPTAVSIVPNGNLSQDQQMRYHQTAHPTAAEQVAAQHSQPSVEKQLSFLSQDTVIAGAPGILAQRNPVASTAHPTTASQTPTSYRGEQLYATAPQVAVPKNPAKPNNKPQKKQASHSQNGLRSLDDLKKMVERLENEIDEYEQETGREPRLGQNKVNTFSGYTASLIAAVTKLISYLKESEAQRKADLVMRDQILQGFSEQRVLVDALTEDIVRTQEQNVALLGEMRFYKKNTDEQLQYLKKELYSVLRSQEHQSIGRSLDTLYSVEPVQLNQAASVSQSFDYLPGAPPLVSVPNVNTHTATSGIPAPRGTTQQNISSQGDGHPRMSSVQSSGVAGAAYIPLGVPPTGDLLLEAKGPSVTLITSNLSADHHGNSRQEISSSEPSTTGLETRRSLRTSLGAFKAPPAPSHSLAWTSHSTRHLTAKSVVDVPVDTQTVAPAQVQDVLHGRVQPRLSQNTETGLSSAAPLTGTTTSVTAAVISVTKASSSSITSNTENTQTLTANRGLQMHRESIQQPSLPVNLITDTVGANSLLPRSENADSSPVAAMPPYANSQITALLGGQNRSQHSRYEMQTPLNTAQEDEDTKRKNATLANQPSSAMARALSDIPNIHQSANSFVPALPSASNARTGNAAYPFSDPKAVSLQGIAVAVSSSNSNVQHGTFFTQANSAAHQYSNPSAGIVSATAISSNSNAQQGTHLARRGKPLSDSQQTALKLRQRFSNLANRQRSGVTGNRQTGAQSTADSKEQPISASDMLVNGSLHVHFQEPVAVSASQHGQSADPSQPLPEKSPAVSPIPFKQPIPSAGPTKQPLVSNGERSKVVVNLPSVWSDVSSTVPF